MQRAERAPDPANSQPPAMRRALPPPAILLLLCTSLAAAGRPLRFLKYPGPQGEFDRRSMVGMAPPGAVAGGRPESVPDLANPDVPAVGSSTASMEGEWQTNSQKWVVPSAS